ncbi:hypothetical protein CRM22_008013 [Opisthorchis felineus]|uniref:Cilia- and flagella-associated protein 70 n=1 Tax=Opisthorchis felineus TaxID=147828 RepID=A0A4S2LL54_OPIFE|nr:hypothetical protein CRM22_008013 [Opisthorchis felineus]
MEKGSKTDKGLSFTVKHIDHVPVEAEQHWYTVKLEFNGITLGESSKVLLTENSPLIINANFRLPCDLTKRSDLELLCNRPLIVSILKHAARSKKQKDGKPVVVGYVFLECTSFVTAEAIEELALPILWQESAKALAVQPVMHMEVVKEAPVFDELEKTSILSVYVESVRGVPDTMQTKETLDFLCTTPLYPADETDSPLVYVNGTLRTPSDKEYTPLLRQWPNYISGIDPSRYIPERSIETLTGDFHSEGDETNLEETLKPKLIWNAEQKVILNSDLVTKLREEIASHRIWPFEVVELKAPESGRERSFELAKYGYHAVAYVNLTPLLYPGVKKIRGAYRLVPYSEEEYTEKTRRPGTIVDEAVRLCLKEKLWASKAPSKRRVQTTERKTSTFHFSSLFEHFLESEDAPTDAESIAKMKQELFYTLNSTGKYFAYKQRLKFAIIKIVREKFFQSKPPCSQDELQAFLRDLFVCLQDEMHTALNKWFSTREIPTNAERQYLDCETLGRFAREAESLGDLGWAARYYEERISREPDEIDHWIDFGTFHLGQKNLEEAEVCFYRALTIQATHVKTLLLYGLVAALLGRNHETTDFLTAAVTHEPENVIAWTTLGLYYETISDDINAENAYKEAKRLNERKEDTENPAEDARPDTTPPRDDGGSAMNVISKQLDQTEKPHSPSLYVITAEFLLDHHVNSFAVPALGHELLLLSELISSCEPKPCPALDSATGNTSIPTSDESTGLAVSNIFVPEWLKERLIRYHLARARLCLTSEYLDYATASAELVQVTELDPENVEGWCLLGHVHNGSGEIELARSCYERCLLLTTWPPVDAHLLQLRLGSMYLESNEFQKAKELFLDASRSSPSSRTWSGVGVACYRMKLDDSTPLMAELHALQDKFGFGNPLARWENEVKCKP